MTPVNLKPSHKFAIKDFFLLGDRSRIEGIKLQALYKLIQRKGEPMKIVSGPVKFDGEKVINIGEGFLIGMKRTPCTPKSFYPCAIHLFTAQEL